MGFLGVGEPLEWQDTEEYYKILEYIIEHGAFQFVEVFNKVKNRRNDALKWGDEVEFHLFNAFKDKNLVQLHLNAKNILEKLSNTAKNVIWHPEWGNWMIESTPSAPFDDQTDNLVSLEERLKLRRKSLESVLAEEGPNVSISSLAVWPRMGCPEFVPNWNNLEGKIANSKYLPDEIINPHPRFATLVRNIRKRRGRNVDIKVPLSNEKNVEMDAMGFGMGCCCLQVTFQARDLKESRYLYDQLAVLGPIFLSLSAASPIFKGTLTERDARWNVISSSVDCRTRFEIGEIEQREKFRGKYKQEKSRYAGISLYISESDNLKNNLKEYNDTNPPINKKVYEIVNQGIKDEILSTHIAHLFTRDPLVIFGDRVDLDDKKTTEHFENIQSTNWQSVRWKPPPYEEENSIGWRVEFRTMEIQLTDFENAAYTVAIVLISRVILFFGLNLYIPISKVDENMERAHEKDSILKQKFFFRKELVVLSEYCGDEEENKEGDYYEEMTILDILGGKGEFPGLFPLIYAYLDIIDADEKTVETLEKYLNFLLDRARGKIKTTARFIRDFVEGHEQYKNDLYVSKEIEYDLVTYCDKITKEKEFDEGLMGKYRPDQDKQKGQRRKLRGASFRSDFEDGDESFKKEECAVILELIAKYKQTPKEHLVTEKRGFDETPAFLDS
eukprot:snap_masked-scaffold_61-processed-gene-0.52-mRNA-1 protein AED:0.02 eAED:0.03 QI:0/0/0/1/1/1/2/0/669